MERKNSKIFKIILVIIDILAVLMMFFVYKRWANNKMNEQIIDEPTNKVIVFNSFTFLLPEDIAYYVTNEKSFIFTGELFQANMEVLIDEDDNIEKKYDTLFYDQLKNNGFDVSAPSITVIDDVNVIGYNYTYEDGVNAVFCYFKFAPSYWAEAILFNEDNSFDVNTLEPVVNILKNAVHDENFDDKDLYYHYVIDDAE